MAFEFAVSALDVSNFVVLTSVTEACQTVTTL